MDSALLTRPWNGNGKLGKMKNGPFLREKSLPSLPVPVSASSDPAWICTLHRDSRTSFLQGSPALTESKHPQPSGSRHFSPGLAGTPAARLSTQTCLQNTRNTNRMGREERGVKVRHPHILRLGWGWDLTQGFRMHRHRQVPTVGSPGLPPPHFPGLN